MESTGGGCEYTRAECQLPLIIAQSLKSAFGVRKNPKPTMNGKAISN